MYLDIPASLITIPRKKLKNNGAATGNSRHRTEFAITEKISFSFGEILCVGFLDVIYFPLKDLGINNLIR